jgi:CBS domain containing-hemolysin-like protein
VALLIAANAFFVAAEFALVAVDRTRAQHLADEGSRRARVVVRLVPRLSFHLSGAQLGITITSLMLGFIAEPTIATAIEPLVGSLIGETATRGVSIALALVLATVAQMVLGELIPKSLAIARPLASALVLGPAVRVYGLVFGPVIRVLNASANATVRLLGIEPREELATVRTLSELGMLFEASAREGTLDQRAGLLLARSIRFGEKTAADVLVPRVEVAAVDADASTGDIAALAAATGHSRFPVFGEDLDDIRGVAHVKSIHGLVGAARSSAPVASIMADALAVPETIGLDDLLFTLQDTRNHLAVVVDEYGGTAGVVTLEDVVEEIVGEIADEYDAPTADLTVAPRPGEWVVPGALHADEIDDVCGFPMPDGDYETLAGFVLDRLGRIPERPGDAFVYEGWTVTVSGVEGLRVAEVRLVAPTEADAMPEDEP